jgi:hypothetical protein
MLLTGNEEKLTCRSIEKAVGKKNTTTHLFSAESIFVVDDLKTKGK